jgi:peptidoglycan hydrolase-like protein with peptidoglycan-binding domain
MLVASILTTVGVCAPQPLPDTMLISIRRPVGEAPDGNLPLDVKVIQSALNDTSPEVGGASPPQRLDGDAGPLTRAAIRQFQRHHFGFHDGRVDINKFTIIRLNELRARRLHPNRIAIIAAYLQEALRVIRAGETNLLMAQAVVHTRDGGGIPALGRTERMRKVNLHFQADKSGTPDLTIREVLRIYQRMKTVFQRPGGIWGIQVFEVNYFPDMERKSAAWTTAGGFDLPNQLRDGEPARADRIYLTGAIDRGSPQATVMRIIHELAHFVGPQDGHGAIDDNGVGGVWVDAPQVVRLGPAQRLKTAQLYATFAMDCAGIRPPGK